MAMNFDDLSTGNSGQVDSTFGNETTQEVKKEAIAQQQRVISELMPDVEFLRRYVDQEVKAVSDIRSYMQVLGDAPTGKDIEIEYRARELYITFLFRFRGNVDDQLMLAEQETVNE
jgi:hypothetical protein